MNRHLQNLLEFILQSKHLSDDEKASLSKEIKEADEEIETIAFKLDRIEQIKKTTAILLEETITELEQKRKAAETQNRELEIEAALERVRSRTMSMQNSGELPQAANLLFQQIQSLGMPAFAAGYCIWEDDKQAITLWMSSEGILQPPFKAPTTDDELFIQMRKGYEEGKSLHVVEMGGEELVAHYQYMRTLPIVGEIFDSILKAGHSLPVFQVMHQAYFSKGFLLFITYEPVPESHDMFKRFASVFDQTYTRFLDLQKAEAQARESQIQLALERVRARTMAMQKSDELTEASFLLDSQVRALGIKTRGCAFNIYGEHDSTEWFSSEMGAMPTYNTPREGIFLRYYNIGKTGAKIHVEEFDGEACKAHYDYLCTLPVMGDALREMIKAGGFFPARQIDHVVYFKYGYLLFITLEPVPEAEEVFIRFAKVFEQTYTRFLDLQKAESQAREAQIEAGLERVRSRAMAMQSSDELGALIGTVFTELTKLDLVLTRCIIWIFEPATNAARWWMANGEEPLNPMNFLIKYHNHPAYLTFVNGWKNQNVKFVYDLKGQDKINWDKILFNETDLKNLPDVVKKGMQAPERVLLSGSFNNFGGINVAGLDSLSEEHFDILIRFARVFDLTYTRFLDLEKAEASAKEAKIEAALERVRSRTMAMQKSDELPETSYLLFQQVKELGLTAVQNSIAIINEETRFVELSTTVHGHHLPHTLNVPIDDPYVMAKAVAAWKAKCKSLKIEVRGQELKDYNEHRNSFFETKVNFPEDQWIVNIVFFSKGWLSFSSDKNISGETFELLKRFAAVFEQTYTRFNDLQKAEAQARESQIEAALERVRAKTMGMHQSKELHEVITQVYNQLRLLQFRFDAVDFITDYTENGFNLWLAAQEFSFGEPIYIAAVDNKVFHLLKEVHKQGKDFFTFQLIHKEKDEYFGHLFNNTILKNVPEELKQQTLNAKGMATSSVVLKNIILSATNLESIPYTDEENAIIKRFAFVFEQAYTRFLDLQKAEASAREAQIEAALEKVRSRSLAMHKSEELHEVANTLFERLNELNIKTDSANIFIFKDGIKDFEIWVGSPYQKLVQSFFIPNTDLQLTRDLISARENETDFYTKTYSREDKNDWFSYVFKNTDLKFLSDERKQMILDADSVTISIALSKNTGVQLTRYADQLLSEGEIEILKRFSKVFEQAYIRFLDLKTAEAQARESQIQLALERVRARTMAMQHSDELKSAATLLFQQAKALGIPAYSCGYNIWEENEKVFTSWMSTQDGTDINAVFNIPLTEDANFIRFAESREKGELFFVLELRGERMQEHYRYLKTIPEFKAYFDYAVSVGFALPETQIHHIANFSHGNLLFITLEPCPEFHDVFKRFAAVFDQTYTRFLDLQKAEAQARESQIQLALERVRARTMAMQKSDELPETSYILFQQMKELGEPAEQLTIGVVHEENNVIEVSATVHGDVLKKVFLHSIDEPYVMNKVYNAWKNQQKTLVIELKGKELNAYNKYRNELTQSEMFPTNLMDVQRRIIYAAFFSKGLLALAANDPRPPQTLELLERFASAFDLTYTRFLDLKKAEAQARESEIQLALERVRARTMAMQKSNEIASILADIFKGLAQLDMSLTRVLFWIFHPEKSSFSWWSANPEIENTANCFEIPFTDHPVFQTYLKAWQNKTELLLYDFGDDLKDSWEDFLFTETPLGQIPIEVQRGMRDERKVCTVSAISDYGLVMAGSSPAPLPKESIDIIQRFGNAFQQSYTRYRDVQKAEAQAREAQIEASLEKVRGKAMAMHNSSDLSVTASMVITELRKLGITPIRCGVGILNKETHKAQLYTATSSPEGDSLSVIGSVLLEEHPVLEKIYQSWTDGVDYFPELSGHSRKSYYEQLLTGLSVPLPDFSNSEKHYGHFFAVSVGCLYAWADRKYNDDEIKIVKRFASIIDLTFRRYFELQQSEENAKEAVKQAALDRIRADIASMRTVNDLDRITPLIWKELTILGIPFIRCGVFIMDEIQQLIHTFLSTPDGSAIAAFHLPYDTPGNLRFVLSNWKEKSRYIDHWNENEFHQFAETLVDQGALDSAENYLKTIPHGGFHLHFLPFLQGMLYVGNTEQLKDEQIELIQHVADAFSTAYARYEDFNKLEAAKQQVEKTLIDLKQAQQQLVQSEKMASLGELTAGIAHEIQNPLNFVNNFSEVNSELIDEVKQEIKKGNIDEVKTILNDIKDNEEKITHHGKRADAIVKGMLQHSRSSSGQKELTDINALTDEYLRLAYHGLRAKDKSFNANFKTELDPAAGIINIVPQEIGRVILNLINNAFYAVNEKQKLSANGYEPTVIVSTEKNKDKVEIKVKDNGDGIPKKVLSKIFQPFFTTKPTGQGTGLGLSLAYDIITKGHGGEITVKTTEGQESEFTIILPLPENRSTNQ